MSQQGDPQPSQEDDWWRQLYDDDAAAAATPDSVDAHFDSALSAVSPPPPPPPSDTLRLRRPTAPQPPPSWQTRTQPEPPSDAGPPVDVRPPPVPRPHQEPPPAPETVPPFGARPPAPRQEPPPAPAAPAPVWDAWSSPPTFDAPTAPPEDAIPDPAPPAPEARDPWTSPPTFGVPAASAEDASPPVELPAPGSGSPADGDFHAEAAPPVADAAPDPVPPADPLDAWASSPTFDAPVAPAVNSSPPVGPPVPAEDDSSSQADADVAVPGAEPWNAWASPPAFDVPAAPPAEDAARAPEARGAWWSRPVVDVPTAPVADEARAPEPPGSPPPTESPAPEQGSPDDGEDKVQAPEPRDTRALSPTSDAPAAAAEPWNAWALPQAAAEEAEAPYVWPVVPPAFGGAADAASADATDSVPSGPSEGADDSGAEDEEGERGARRAWDVLGGAPGAGDAWGETGFAEGDVRWAPDLPPGWVAAEEAEVAEPGVVGGGPPTYAAEPTAWPEAQPDDLGALVADTVLDGAQYGNLTLRSVSLRGDSARYRGHPRRDALLTARFGSGDDALLLVAMASGARAADDAHRAAQDAVRWIAGAVGRSRNRLSDDLRASRRGSLKSGLHRLTDRCYGRLRARGEDLGLDEGTYTASLRCLLLPADPACRIRLFFGVGDGGLFRIRDGAWQDLDLAPDEQSAPFRFRASVAQPGDALVMCSGGLAEPLRGEPALAAHLAERWGGPPPGMAAYLADTQTRVKGYADDRTAVTVWDA